MLLFSTPTLMQALLPLYLLSLKGSLALCAPLGAWMIGYQAGVLAGSIRHMRYDVQTGKTAS